MHTKRATKVRMKMLTIITSTPVAKLQLRNKTVIYHTVLISNIYTYSKTYTSTPEPEYKPPKRQTISQPASIQPNMTSATKTIHAIRVYFPRIHKAYIRLLARSTAQKNIFITSSQLPPLQSSEAIDDKVKPKHTWANWKFVYA